MNNKQNYKIMQITESTLVIGVDIAKKQHYAIYGELPIRDIPSELI